VVTEGEFDPSPEAVRELVGHLDALSGAPGTLFAWRGGDRRPDGVITMPWVDYAEPVRSFLADAGRLGFIVVFDWPAWVPTAERIQSSPEEMAGASLFELAKLLTLHIRRDRFVEGHLANALEAGWIQDILRAMRDRVDPPS